MTEIEKNSWFRYRDLYPEPSNAFFFETEPIDKIKENCFFVLDTNVLLLPYTTDVKSLNAIKDIYQSLAEADRLFIPAHVAREFLEKRSQKLSDINESLSKKMNQSIQYVGNLPLLSELVDFKSLLKQEDKLKTAFKEYQEEIKKNIKLIQTWRWDDPVSKMYHEVLKNRVLSDSFIDIDKFSVDFEKRSKNNLPPGFKDKNKDYNQAGDLLIWYEILNLGKTKKNHVIFVSGDEKNDWWHQSGKNPLYPRFELTDEFRINSENKSFHILNLSDVLKLFSAEPDVLEAIIISENNEKRKTRQSILSNTELIEQALKICREIRFEISQYMKESETLLKNRILAMANTSNDEEKKIVWEQFNEIDREPIINLMASYESKYKIDAIILRDEISKRLTNNYLEDIKDVSYLHPTTTFGLSNIADNLEYLAKCLPV